MFTSQEIVRKRPINISFNTIVFGVIVCVQLCLCVTALQKYLKTNTITLLVNQ